MLKSRIAQIAEPEFKKLPSVVTLVLETVTLFKRPPVSVVHATAKACAPAPSKIIVEPAAFAVNTEFCVAAKGVAPARCHNFVHSNPV